MKNSMRQTIRESQKNKQKSQKFLMLGAAALIVLVVVIFVVKTIDSNKPVTLMGDPVVVDTRAHVPDSVKPGPYNSNPPAGGSHYEVSYKAKFFQEADLGSLSKYPEGHLVHSLEHGYVIFWYNCQITGVDCASLKATIQDVMDKSGGDKLIAFPWTNMDFPLAMTSWGRIQNFTSPDSIEMAKFVEHNRYQAPEVDAP